MIYNDIFLLLYDITPVKKPSNFDPFLDFVMIIAFFFRIHVHIVKCFCREWKTDGKQL